VRAETDNGREHPDDELRRRLLLQYVQNVEPQIMDQFVQRAPAQVVDAMRQTITNMLGTLPPQFFDVSVSTIGENLAQMMYSVMMTGYMFRNAQYRIELKTSMAALPSADQATPSIELSTAKYADGNQKVAISGEVLRWNEETGVEATPASEYIESLEAEVALLKDKLAALSRVNEGRNDVLDYLKGLEPTNLQELTSTAGPDVLEAMNAFIYRLIGTSDAEELKAPSETTAQELARLLYWLMVVGYSLRTMEVRFEMNRSLGLPPSAPELPPA